jgi:lysophospholipase L1-like esterase
MAETPHGGAGRARTRTRLVVAFAAVLAALGAAELVARVVETPPAPGLRLAEFARVVEEQHKVDFEQVFAPDPELFWRLAPDVVLPETARPLFGRVSNRRGLREAREIGPKAPGEVRLLFVGDSCTFGYRLALEDALPQRVEAELAKALPGARVVCVNAGVPGYTLFQGWRFLELEGWAYEPDLVVLQFGWNESAPWDSAGDPERHAERLAGLPPPGLRWSALARALARRLAPARAPAADETKRPRLTGDEFRATLASVRSAAAARGIPLVAFVAAARANLEPGGRRTEYQQALLELGEGPASPETPPAATGSSLPGAFDALPVLRRLARGRSPRELFLDGVHPTAEANARLAAALAERLAPWVEVEAARR